MFAITKCTSQTLQQQTVDSLGMAFPFIRFLSFAICALKRRNDAKIWVDFMKTNYSGYNANCTQQSVCSTSNQAPVVQRANSYFLSSGYNRYTKDNIFRLASFRLFEAWIYRVIQPGAIQRIKLISTSR